ncbi:hypothetical protein BJF87_21340 [Gordonia sp. CNJ-863]|nr:hypothetical protein BJF87_21340 [Gordonia sp. CNJ-863]
MIILIYIDQEAAARPLTRTVVIDLICPVSLEQRPRLFAIVGSNEVMFFISIAVGTLFQHDFP